MCTSDTYILVSTHKLGEWKNKEVTHSTRAIVKKHTRVGSARIALFQNGLHDISLIDWMDHSEPRQHGVISQPAFLTHNESASPGCSSIRQRDAYLQLALSLSQK